MKSQAPSLSKLLKSELFPLSDGVDNTKKCLKELQLKMLRISQGIWHQERRAIILFEGFDAAGKGGAIQRLTEKLDPRTFQAHLFGKPNATEQGKHYLYRFWKALPPIGNTAILDRSWYGRVLVERVNHLTPKKRWRQAYREINEFERMLLDDGIDLVKVFLAIDKREQSIRFEQRRKDPYKQWKLTDADIEAHARWDDYVKATDDMFEQTHSKKSPWHLIAANDKNYSRLEVLSIVTDRLSKHGRWIEKKAKLQK